MKSAAIDRDRIWRRLWRIIHSPAVLVPVFITCTAAASADVVEAVPKFGWVGGVIMAVLLTAGVIVAAADLVPHLIGWLADAHAAAIGLLNRIEPSLRALSERIKAIASDR